MANSLSNAKNQIKNLLLNIKLLEENEKELRKTLTTLPSTQWNTKLSDLNLTKTKITETLQEYENSLTLSSLQKLIRNRKSRRARKKRRNAQLQLQKKNLLKKRKKLHENIDQWLENEKQKNFKNKRAEESAKHAEVVLSSVTTKKNDARRYIQLLNSLKELRKARRIALQKDETGENEFNSKINNLIAVWNDALEEYDLEEDNLKSILDNTHKSIEDQWKEILFGRISKDNKKLMLIAEQNFENFLEIRRSWDSCIVPNNNSFGSCIPRGWILPPENPSNKWRAYKKF